MKHWWHYKIYILVLLFFAADKLLLLPGVSKMVIVRPDRPSNILAFDHEEVLAQAGRRHVWFLGTSRTVPFAFAPSDKDIEASPGLSNSDRAFLKTFHIHSFGLMGARATVFRHQVLYLRERGYRPDRIFIELSGMSLNRSDPGRKYYDFQYSPDAFIISHMHRYGRAFLSEYIISKAFVSGLYPIRFQSEKDRNDLAIMNKQLATRIDLVGDGQLHTRQGNDRDEAAFPNPSLDPIFASYLQFYADSQMLSTFAIDPVEVENLEALIQDLQAEQIPIVLWRPRVHPHFHAKEQSTGAAQKYQAYMEELRKRFPRIPYLDLQQGGPLSCPFFSDPNHVSSFCYTPLALQLLRFSEK